MCPRTEKQFEEMREQKREIICNSALELFAEHGFHSTSISEIAKKAGVSKGLMYNYFKNKEDLLSKIFQRCTDNVMELLNPDFDDVITDEEAEDFFDKFFDVLISNPQEWKLFFQVSIQSDVMDLLMKEMHSQNIQKGQKMILDYFNTHGFQDPETAVLLFSSVFKGFTLQYALAPELFSKELLERFKQKIKELFLRKVDNNSIGKLELNDSTRYFLL